MKLIHCRSVCATCLMRPPRHSSLAVVRCPACSSVRPQVVWRRKYRCLASVCSRSARSLVAIWSGAVWSGVAMVSAFGRCRHGQRYGPPLTVLTALSVQRPCTIWVVVDAAPKLECGAHGDGRQLMGWIKALAIGVAIVLVFSVVSAILHLLYLAIL